MPKTRSVFWFCKVLIPLDRCEASKPSDEWEDRRSEGHRQVWVGVYICSCPFEDSWICRLGIHAIGGMNRMKPRQELGCKAVKLLTLSS